MPDSLLTPGPADRARLNVDAPHEVRYWSRVFNCSEARLREVVQQVGPLLSDLRVALRRR